MRKWTKKTIRNKQIVKYWHQKENTFEKIQYCCSQSGFFFHDSMELGQFSNEDDFFNLNEEISLQPSSEYPCSSYDLFK